MSQEPEAHRDIPAVVGELLRGANRIGLLGAPEKQRLLELAAKTVEEGRRRVALSGPQQGWHPEEPTFRWRTMSIMIRDQDDDRVQAALLEAAEIIRALKIILDAKDEVLAENKPERGG